MEILRFDEPDAPTPKRKRPSKAWLALSLVAALMGVGTAFASSTININGNNLTPLGQGVSTATTCDNQINVTPDAALVLPSPTPSASEDNLTQEETVSNAPTFRLGSITVGAVNINTPDETTGIGCFGLDFKLQVYKNRSHDGGATFQAERLTCEQLVGTLDLDVRDVYANASLSHFTCDSTAGDVGGIYFRVESTNPNKQAGTFKIVLDGSTDFDYITLVSTNYAPFNS